MAKDEELLLVNLEKGSGSDSDEVVEEFKLPPPRVRRKRKILPDARLHGSGSSLFTWRCCFSFIVASILISGGLVLAFFIYNLHSQVYDLKRHLERYEGNSNTIFSKHEQKINELEAKHSSVLSFIATHEALVKKVDQLSEKVKEAKGGQSSEDTTEFKRQIKNIKTDLETLQSSTAKAEATFSSTQQMLLKTVKKLNKDVQSMQVDSLNPTETTSNGGDDQEGEEEYMTKPEVNALLKKFSDRLFDGQSSSNQDISELKAQYQNLNMTHNQDLLKLARNVISLKQSNGKFQETFASLYKPIIIDLRNATRDVFKQLKLHNNSFLNLETTVKALQDDIISVNKSYQNTISIAIPLTGNSAKPTVLSQSPATAAPQQPPTTEMPQQPISTENATLTASLSPTQHQLVNATEPALETPSANATMTVPEQTPLINNGTSIDLPVTPMTNNGTTEMLKTNATTEAENEQSL